jgi:predicted DNA-binding protein
MSRESTFPESTLLRFPTGTLERVRVAAKADGTTTAEWMRTAIRKALDTRATAEAAR